MIALNTFASPSAQEAKRRRIVELTLRSQFSDEEMVIRAIEIPHICQDIEETAMDVAFIASFKKLGKNVADELIHPSVITNSGISVLIGSDQMWKVLTGEVSRCEGNESLIALNSRLGWTFQGSTANLMSRPTASRNMVCVLKVQATDSYKFLRSFLEVENMGITETIGKPPELSKTVPPFKNTVIFPNLRYEVALHWKDTYELQSNTQVDVARQENLVNHLNTKKGLLETCEGDLKEYLRRRRAEVVSDGPSVSTKLYYMPHKEVVREQALTTKTPVMFDATERGDTKCHVAPFTCAVPSVIYSDNARSSHEASADIRGLHRMISEEKVAGHRSTNGISCKFTALNSPRYNGWWERLLRSEELPQRNIVGKAHLIFEEVATVRTEVEEVTNCGRLTFLATDTRKPCSLSPAELLFRRRLTSIPYAIVDEVRSNSQRAAVIRRLSYRELLVKTSWKRRQKEYTCRNCDQRTLLTPDQPQRVEQGGVVLVRAHNTPHQLWKLARSWYRSANGLICSSKIKSQEGVLAIRMT